MAFTTPVFNIEANIWRAPAFPPDPPTFVVDAQLYINSREFVDIVPTDNNQYQPAIWLRVAPGTDIIVGDTVEAARGDGWLYTVRWTDRFHRGFSNEYFGALLEQFSTVPPTESFIELEDGTGHVAMESTGGVLLE